MASGEKSKKKVLRGVVVSDKMDKTVRVLVERTVMDPTYKKYLKKRKEFMAHDESDQCRVGDRVEIIESRPLSRNKRFSVLKVLERGAIIGEEVAGNDSN